MRLEVLHLSSAFVLYLFCNLASSTAIQRAPQSDQGLVRPADISFSPILVTVTTAIVETVEGVSTSTNVVFTTSTYTAVSTYAAASTIPSSTPTTHAANRTVVIVSVCVVVVLLMLLILWGIVRRRRTVLMRTEILSARDPKSSKHTSNPFDSGLDAPRASWASDTETGVRISTASSTTSTRRLYISELDAPRASWGSYIETGESISRVSSTASTRQLYISNQMNRAREKVTQLENMSTRLRYSSHSDEGSTRTISRMDRQAVPRQVGREGEETSNGPSDLESAIREIAGLNNRIRELELQRRSSWALGLSDDPPPGYTEDA
ncbi:hypothetical protein DFH06DRAFT_1150724 [Mycena polygramma]|nr:hypothetical protein DFH06DRAFT_1150724 [Mycena polygramma]